MTQLHALLVQVRQRLPDDWRQKLVALGREEDGT